MYMSDNRARGLESKAVAALLFLSTSVWAANPAPTTVTYQNSNPAKPDTLDFRIGDRLTLSTNPRFLRDKLVGRTLTVTGRIRWFREEVVTGKRKKSSFGCGRFKLKACYEETRERRYDELSVSKATPTQFDSFLEVGPVLVLSTPSGNKSFALMGADSTAREALRKDGFTYVALHSGTLHFGRLVLPLGTFDGSPSATEQEKKDGEAWVQSQCTGRPECTFLANPPVQVTATAGNVVLELTVTVDRPAQAVNSP